MLRTKNREHLAAWQRIQAYQFDEPGAVRTFAGRLALENRWTVRFANRVVEEYRRFAFLSVACGHPVSPSETIDEAWHLHLQYTKSYWNVFCPDVLGQPLHHMPSTGTDADRAKYDDWYARTLASYAKFFGPPPADIWPSPAERERTHVRQVHVDAERVWILPKPRLPAYIRWLAVVCVLVLLGGCAGQAAWPLNLRGPEFLGFFSSLIVGLASITGAVMYWIRTGPADELDPELNANEIAYLAGGTPRLVGTIVTQLNRDGYLEVEPGTGLLVTGQPLPPDASDLEHEIVELIDEGTPLPKIVKQVQPLVEPIRQRLIEPGLLVSDATNWTSRLILWSAGLCLIGLGLAKISVGLDRHKPVEFLTTMVIGLAIYLIAMCRSAHRTFAGAAIQNQLLTEHANLKRFDPETSALQHLPLALALFGPVTLLQTEYDGLRKLLVPSTTGTGSSGSSCGGVGAGCGGGGGCGGGCGGGGCGGCGS